MLHLCTEHTVNVVLGCVCLGERSVLCSSPPAEISGRKGSSCSLSFLPHQAGCPSPAAWWHLGMDQPTQCWPSEESHSWGRGRLRDVWGWLFSRSSGMSWGVRITHICWCVNVQLCLISEAAVMFAQDRIWADQRYRTLPYRKRPAMAFLNGSVFLQYINKSWSETLNNNHTLSCFFFLFLFQGFLYPF